jgi:hypothetical protein
MFSSAAAASASYVVGQPEYGIKGLGVVAAT